VLAGTYRGGEVIASSILIRVLFFLVLFILILFQILLFIFLIRLCTAPLCTSSRSCDNWRKKRSKIRTKIRKRIAWNQQSGTTARGQDFALVVSGVERDPVQPELSPK